MAVGYWVGALELRDGLGEGFDLSVTLGGEDRGAAVAFGWGWFWVVLRGGVSRVGVTATVRPGVVTVSEEAVVVLVLAGGSMCRRT